MTTQLRERIGAVVLEMQNISLAFGGVKDQGDYWSQWCRQKFDAQCH